MSEDGVEKILWRLGLVIAPTVLIGIELFHPQGFTEPPPGMYQYLSKPESVARRDPWCSWSTILRSIRSVARDVAGCCSTRSVWRAPIPHKCLPEPVAGLPANQNARLEHR